MKLYLITYISTFSVWFSPWTSGIWILSEFLRGKKHHTEEFFLGLLLLLALNFADPPPPPKPSANIWTMKPKCSIFFCFFLFCLKSLYKMSVSLPTVLHILPEFNVKYIFPPCWTPKKNFRKQCSLIELCNDGNVLYSESHVPVDNLKCDQCEWGSEFKFYWQN